MKYIFSSIAGVFIGASILLGFGVYLVTQQEEESVGAPSANLFREISPVSDNQWDVGTSTARWRRVFVQYASSTAGSFFNQLDIGNTSTTTIRGDSATSTFDGGVFANAFRSNLPSCDTLDTDSTGAIICGTDATGAGGSGQIDWELFNNIGQRATTTGKSLFVRGDYTSTTTQDRLEVAGRATVHHLLTVGYLTATSTVSTSTIAYGLNITNGGLDINLPSCTGELETDSNGSIVCGTQDVTGDWTGTIDSNNFAGGAIGVGELIYGGSAGSFSELAAGTRGTILSMTTGGIPGWVSTSTFAHLRDNNVFTGTGSTTFAGNVDVTGDVHADSRLTTDDILFVRGAGTSTFVGGVFANDLRTNLPSCDSLDTNSSGAIVCGADATGGGFEFPFDTNATYASTSTILGFLSGMFSNGSTTVTGQLNVED